MNYTIQDLEIEIVDCTVNNISVNGIDDYDYDVTFNLIVTKDEIEKEIQLDDCLSVAYWDTYDFEEDIELNYETILNLYKEDE